VEEPIQGLEIASERAGSADPHRGASDRLVGAATPEVCEWLLARVTRTTSLVVFDPEYPSRSDPGAFAQIARGPDGLVANLANYGWSTSFAPISASEAVKLVRVCAEYSREPMSEPLRLGPRVDPGWGARVSPWPWAAFRRYLVRRLGR